MNFLLFNGEICMVLFNDKTIRKIYIMYTFTIFSQVIFKFSRNDGTLYISHSSLHPPVYTITYKLHNMTPAKNTVSLNYTSMYRCINQFGLFSNICSRSYHLPQLTIYFCTLNHIKPSTLLSKCYGT